MKKLYIREMKAFGLMGGKLVWNSAGLSTKLQKERNGWYGISGTYQLNQEKSGMVGMESVELTN